MAGRAFCDTSVLIRYFVGDDPPRAFAAAGLIESATQLVVSTGVLIELLHALRTKHGMQNPGLGEMLIGFLSRPNVELVDADKDVVLAALFWTQNSSARRVPDAILIAAAYHAGADFIATFDEKMTSPTIPVRML